MAEVLEGRILEVAGQLENINDELESIFKTHGYTVGAISDAGMESRVDSLEWQATRLYQATVPQAHEIYASWPKPKRVRAERQLRLEMAKAGSLSFNQGGIVDGVKEIRLGKYNPLFPDLPMNSGQILEVAYGLRGVVAENKNPDVTDSYWERIRDVVTIEPRPGYSIPIILAKEDGFGSFDSHRFNETSALDSRRSAIKNLRSLIESLIGGKIIFYPIKTSEQSVAYEIIGNMNIELPFEFEVRDWDHNAGQFLGESKGKVVAAEYNPFTEGDSDFVVNFFGDHILKNKS